jgi:hypothetical protein
VQQTEARLEAARAALIRAGDADPQPDAVARAARAAARRATRPATRRAARPRDRRASPEARERASPRAR